MNCKLSSPGQRFSIATGRVWRRLLLVGALFLLFASAIWMPAADSFASAFISEILADDPHGLKDENGEHHGWIEICNGGNRPVNLAGWFLTDERTNLTRWRFPGVVLLPDKYLIVFASGRNRTNDLTHLHAGFRLDQRGGYLALVNPATNIVSELAPSYPAQSTDRSYGSVPGEPAVRGAFPQPTPGRRNHSSGAGFVPEVSFSRAQGNFSDSFSLRLSIPAPDAVIRYTLDGKMPNSRSPAYTAPLAITNTTHLRARAYQDGLLPGPAASAAYLQLLTNATAFTSTLPLLVLDTFGENEPISTRASFAHLSFHEPINGRASLTNSPELTTRAAYRIRGSTSSGMPQSGFAVEFLDEFNGERHLPVLGLPADSDWILYAPNAYDPVLIHNPFVHQLSRDMGRYSPCTRFLEVFFVTGAGPVRESHYNGVYVLEEKIKVGPNRVNIDRLAAEDVLPPAVTGGYLLKFDRLGPDENGVFFTGDRGMVYVEPREQTIMLPQRAAQRQYVTKYFTDFERALDGPDWKDPAKGYRAYLDVDAAIDFHVLEVLSGNVDALVLSTYFHKPRNGRIIFGPHWDFDRALGSTDGRDDDPRMWSTGPFFGGAWWPRLFSDPDFWQRWVDRWQELRQSHFAFGNLCGLIDRLAAQLRDAQPRQYQRWAFQPRGGSYQSEIRLMKDWLSNRVDFIDGQLVQPPRLDSGAMARNVLAFSAPTNVTVYYTLDGSDPRQPQGGIASNAVVYISPVPLQSQHRVIARARNPSQRQRGGPPISTPWSGPVTARTNQALPAGR